MKTIKMKILQKKSALLLLLSITFLGIGNASAQKLKVLSYNVLVGMQTDTTREKKAFVEWIKKQDPDILAFQEMNKFTQQSLEAMARKYGHTYAVLLREQGYPVALTSKAPIVNVRKVIDNMHHGFIVAETMNYNILVLHLSPHKYWKRREEMDVILQTIAAQPSQKKWIVMGDFNSLSPLDKENYTDGKLLECYQAAAKKHSFHENLVDGKLDYAVQQKVLDFGLVDAVKEYEKKYISSTPTNYEKPVGSATNRIDYIYVSKDLKSKIRRAIILKDDFTRVRSDHFPVLLEIVDKN